MNYHEHVEHVFRHEYGKLVASLLRRVGVMHIEAVEDAVQEAMIKGLDHWSHGNIPDKPSAWLYTVAYRQLMSELRSLHHRQERLSQLPDMDKSLSAEQAELPLPGEMNDSMLRMLFVTCHSEIAAESRLVFTLKCLCGFSVKEIALRLFISEANVYKRFSRARKILQIQSNELDSLTHCEMSIRLPMVHNVLYLIFTEGYLSSQTDTAIRKDLCHEAIRLALIILDSSLGNSPETLALLALMYFHLSRMDTRLDESGALLLLEQQDRSNWDKDLIKTGLRYLEKSANGKTISRYHLEANIAAEHCLAPSFAQTRWGEIARSYELLERVSPTVLHRLNWAIAKAQWQGPDAGLAILKSCALPVWLERSYYWYSVMADLQFRCGEIVPARKNAKLALEAAPTECIKNLLIKRLEKYEFDEKTPRINDLKTE